MAVVNDYFMISNRGHEPFVGPFCGPWIYVIRWSYNILALLIALERFKYFSHMIPFWSYYLRKDISTQLNLID